MLLPCSPCCGPSPCPGQILQAINQSDITLTLSGNLPQQQAATRFSRSINWDTVSQQEADAGFQTSFNQWTLYGQTESPIGSHVLAYSPVGGQSRFVASDDGYSIAVVFSDAAVAPTVADTFVWPGTDCRIAVRIDITLFGKIRTLPFSAFSLPSGLSQYSRTYTETISGTPTAVTKYLAIVNAPNYSQDGFTQNFASKINHGGQMVGFDAWWNADLYHPQVSQWTENQVAALYQWFSAEPEIDGDAIVLGAGAFTRNANWFSSPQQLSYWDAYSPGSSVPEWVSSLSVASQLDANNQFVSQYQASSIYRRTHQASPSFGVTSAELRIK